jgi:hypothetical protein
MGMPGEAGEVVGGDVVAEIVEQEKRVEVGGVAEAERAAEVDTGTFEGGFGFDDLVDGSNGHVSSFCWLRTNVASLERGANRKSESRNSKQRGMKSEEENLKWKEENRMDGGEGGHHQDTGCASRIRV